MCRIVFNYKNQELFWRAYVDEPVPRMGEYVAYNGKMYIVNAVLYHYDKNRIGIQLIDYHPGN